MEIKEGFYYHIKENFFVLANDVNLQINKDNDKYRPHYFALKDENNENIFWMVPVSSQVAKYSAIQEKIMKRYGKCTTIVLGRCADKPAAFLIQNAFPTIAKYFDHIHSVGDIPVVLHSGTAKVVKKFLESNLRMHEHGVNLFFADIDKIYELMLAEIGK